MPQVYLKKIQPLRSMLVVIAARPWVPFGKTAILAARLSNSGPGGPEAAQKYASGAFEDKNSLAKKPTICSCELRARMKLKDEAIKLQFA